MLFEDTLSFAKNLDANDRLAPFRDMFYIPKINENDCIYMCGNSLGLQPKIAQEYIQVELDEWKNLGVEGHFEGKNPWYSYHHILENKLSKIVGAKPLEVVAMNTLTVNLNLLMVSFYQPTNKRYKILVEADAFPSDHYALRSQIKVHTTNCKNKFPANDALVEIYPRKGEHLVRTEDIVSKINELGDSLALVMLGGVNYYTGQFFNLKNITDAGHQVGAKVGFDLAHAVGNVELKLHDWNVDFATWCSYKYLNSGPGGVGGIYVNESHCVNTNITRFEGWWGNNESTRFQMKKVFDPQKSAGAWQMSNAQIFPMALHNASLDVFMQAGLENLFAKSKMLTNYFEFLMNKIEGAFEIITPNKPNERGCQLSLLTNKNGKQLFDKLSENGVVADWREPNVIRMAPVPLYNSFEDLWNIYNILNKN